MTKYNDEMYVRTYVLYKFVWRMSFMWWIGQVVGDGGGGAGEGVLPTMSEASTLAPKSRSTSTTARCPLAAAVARAACVHYGKKIDRRRRKPRHIHKLQIH